jgi:uncharacterized YigZ family protein
MGRRILFLLFQRKIDISDTYRSLSKTSEGFYKEKGSKFMAFAIPVESVDSAKGHIQELRNQHPKAAHVCFAWRIGIDKHEDRYSDDGEPNNSAGKPIFGQIIAAEITNVLIAVVRYYGGTKLGVGGLVNAYKTAAKDAIDKSEIISKVETVSAIIRFNPSHTGDLMSLLNKMGIDINSHGFAGMNHQVIVSIKKSARNEILNTFENLPQFEIELK